MVLPRCSSQQKRKNLTRQHAPPSAPVTHASPIHKKPNLQTYFVCNIMITLHIVHFVYGNRIVHLGRFVRMEFLRLIR